MNPYLIQLIELTPLLINVSGHRIPNPQAGYVVGFIPFEEGVPKGEMEIFSDGFIGREVISDMEESEHRPMGLAQRPHGSFYISESKKGKMWRIIFNGSKEILVIKTYFKWKTENLIDQILNNQKRC